MKATKKLFALLLVVVMTLALGAVAFADNSDVTDGSIEVVNPIDDVDYKVSKIFDVTYSGSNYAYSIDAESPWLADVLAYANADDTTDADGLTLTPVKDAAGTILSYNVSFTNAFSAPDFAQAMIAATKRDTDPVVPTAGDGYTEALTNGKADGLDLGYWILLPSNGALASLTTTNADVTIYDKNEKPAVDKEIIDKDELLCTKLDEDAEDYDDTHEHDDSCYATTEIDEASIGDTVPYVLTTKVPDMTGYSRYFFVVHDTLSEGLTFNDDVTITLGGTTLAEGTGYTVDIVKDENDDPTGEIRIIFKDMLQYQAEHVGDTIVIKYSATVNEDAEIDDANSNDAYVQYSNDPTIKPEEYTDPNNPPDDPDDPDDPNYEWDEITPTGDGPHDDTDVYTTELTVYKVDENNQALTGAKFLLTGESLNKVITTADNYVPYADDTNTETPYWKLKDGTYTEQDPAEVTYELDENGGYVLENGVYRARQDGDVAPFYKQITVDQSKYESITATYMKKTEVTYDTKTSGVSAEAFVDADGKIVFTGLGEGTYTLTETVVPDGYNAIDPITVTVKFDDEADEPFFYIEELAKDSDEDGVKDQGFTMTMTVENTTGTILPATGGVGTVILIAVGALLFMGTALVLVTKKRMYNEG